MTRPAGLYLRRASDMIARAGALIFDVDGTLAETEEIHRQAFNEVFAKAGIDWCWDRAIYKQLLQVTGGKERIRAFDRMRGAGPSLSDRAVAELHAAKTGRYAELVAGGGCPLRPGVEALIAAAQRRGQRLAIATTTTLANIEALLSVPLGRDWARRFDAVVGGDEVARKKPAPDVYLEVLARLALPASDCVAIEDSRNGLLAAARAGIPVLVTRSVYFRDEDFSEALLVIDDLTALAPD